MQLNNAINFDKDKLFNSNLPFAKLYVITLDLYLKKYNTNIHDPIPHKELNRLIDQPYQHIVENFTTQLNNKLRFDLIESAGYEKDKHPIMLSDAEKENIISNLKKKLELSCNHDIWMGKAWNTKEVEKRLRSTIEKILAWNRAN